MARSILILCVVFSALVHMNLALLGGNSVGKHLEIQFSELITKVGKDSQVFADAAIIEVDGIDDGLKVAELTEYVESLPKVLDPVLVQVTNVDTSPVTKAVGDLQGALEGLKGAVGSVVSSLKELLAGLVTVVSGIVNVVGTILNLDVNTLTDLAKSLTETLNGVVTQVAQITSALVSGLGTELISSLTISDSALTTISEFLEDNLLSKTAELAKDIIVLVASALNVVLKIAKLLILALSTVLVKVIKLLKYIEGFLVGTNKDLVGALTETINSVSKCTDCINGAVSLGRRRRSYVRY